MRKQIMAIVITLCMILSLLPTAALAAGDSAKPSTTGFVMNGKAVIVPEAYDVNNGNNCLQLRGIAVLLNGTTSQFNVSWDGKYAVIETGKPYTGSANPAKLKETTDVRKSSTQFSIDGRITSFDYAYFIDGDTNYLKLREVAAQLIGTASQFNLYYDDVKKQAVIEPGKPYTGLAPTAVTAQNYLEEDVTWIGSTAEYQKTLAAFFDNGLRLMPVGTIAADGAFVTGKYGLVDSSGRWAAQPVYDKIKAEYWIERQFGDRAASDYYHPNEHIFVDGYVQATKNGKMGLLDSTGREVIPCEYKAVGLPVEGVSRLIQEINGKEYIGYWNLELGKEIVMPNKYIADYSSSAAGSAIKYGSYYKPASDKRMVSMFDFNDGYALVLTGKSEKIAMNAFTDHGGGINDIRWNGEVFDTKYTTVEYAQLIDKNGKEILPQAYPIHSASLSSNGTYPQNGPYMVYQAVSNNKIMVQSDQGGDWKGFDTHLEEGVVGASGIVVAAKYWGGFWANDGPGLFRFLPNPYGASTAIYANEGIIVTTSADYTQSELSGKNITGEQKIINFQGKEINANPPKGTAAKAIDPDGNMVKIEYGLGIISGVQAKVSGDDSRVAYLVDVQTGKRLTEDQFVLKSLGRGLFVTNYGDYFGPDGKIVFPRAETTTVVKNNPNANEQTVGYDLTLVIRDGKVGYVNASRLAVNGKLPTTARVKPNPPAMPDWTKWIEKAEPVSVPAGVDLLADGSYYMQIFGKYLVPVETDSNEYSVKLSSTKPAYPFVVKLVSYNTDSGPAYDITYNDGATWSATKDGAAFKFGKGGVDPTSPKWKISKYTNFYTVRSYANQALAVNASGAKNTDGTNVTVWTYTGSAPEHAKINFIKAN